MTFGVLTLDMSFSFSVGMSSNYNLHFYELYKFFSVSFENSFALNVRCRVRLDLDLYLDRLGGFICVWEYDDDDGESRRP